MLDKVKETLRITWDSDDAYLASIIARGEQYLKDLTGTEPDFAQEGLAQNLLLDYCRYEYNQATEYFEDNYHKEILRLQLSEALRGKDHAR
ncbi:hypothetical protein PEPNEM18_01043 [Aedoeadaptatus nemausensis]|uniref:Phage gp6-like head-tail connector protein n=1 Tax=Aedoeadaptatus nemausensis TaxID=2582829 RepID=A0A6V6Y408_9FIRM|nr:head-tail connector protein [Peptoniphilus nemausensis]CAC9931686.1 hypothetical protein PEPNEM18_01043 [Peptoniphilus nemausensis]